MLFSFVDPTDLSQVGFYTTHDTRPGFLASIGLPTPAIVEEESANTTEFYVKVSSELADRFADVDLIVTYGEADGAIIEQVKADPLLSQIPAVASGSFAILQNSTPLAASANPSPLSIGWGIEDYFALLADGLQAASDCPARTVTDRLAHAVPPAGVARHGSPWCCLSLVFVYPFGAAPGRLRRSPGRHRRHRGSRRSQAASPHGAGHADRGGTVDLRRDDAGRHAQPAGRAGHSRRVQRRIAVRRVRRRVLGISDPYSYMGLAVRGAAVASVFVYVVGSMGRGGATPLKLALAGAATTAASARSSSAILLPRVDVMSSFRFWQIGGVGGATWERIGIITPFLALGCWSVCSNARGMNTLALGDDMAAGLGANVARTRWPRRRGRSCSVASRPRSPGRSGSSGSSCRTCAGSSSAPITGGCCRSARSLAPRCSSAPTSSVGSSHARRRSRSASSLRSSVHRY